MIYQKIPKKWLFSLWQFWPPFWGSGISVHILAEDLSHIQTRLKLRWWNRNYVGTQFGGSMFSMTDPIYMIMMLQGLGCEYIVWDKAASIRYWKPGKTSVYADYRLTPENLDQIRKTLQTQEKMDWTTKVEIRDMNDELIAEVEKVLYIRKKKPKVEGG